MIYCGLAPRHCGLSYNMGDTLSDTSATAKEEDFTQLHDTQRYAKHRCIRWCYTIGLGRCQLISAS